MSDLYIRNILQPLIFSADGMFYDNKIINTYEELSVKIANLKNTTRFFEEIKADKALYI